MRKKKIKKEDIKKKKINIRDVSSWIELHFGESERFFKEFNEEEYDKLIQENSHRLGAYRKYLIQLHDSYVINTRFEKNKFSVTLDEHATGCFAWEVIKNNHLKVNKNLLVFPLQIDFEIIDISFNKVDEKGYIKEINPLKFDEYLYNYILSIDKDKMEIAWIVWRNGTKKNERAIHILILMNLKSITVTEMQDQAWEKLFGNAYNDYYNYFKEQLEAGRYLSESNVCKTLYKEYENKFNY